MRWSPADAATATAACGTPAGLEANGSIPYLSRIEAGVDGGQAGEPKLVELKFYARGVGPVMEVPISGESGRTVLTSTTRAG